MRQNVRLAMAMRLAVGVNPYLNTPPTELARMIKSEKDKGKRKLMRAALRAWRSQTSFGANESSPPNIPAPDGGAAGGGGAEGMGMAQRRMSKTALRTVAIDKPFLEREARSIAQEVVQFVGALPDEPVGAQNLVLQEFKVKNMLGETIRVTVVVLSKPASTSGPLVLGAGAGRDPRGGQFIRITLNGGRSPSEFKQREIYTEVRRTLFHEVTHVMDVSDRATPTVAPTNYEQWTRYFNLPREVRAYMQEIVDQVLHALPRAKARPSWSMIERALAKSRTWADIGPHLNPTNRKKVLKAVAAAVEGVMAGRIARLFESL